jgi:TonB family protein
LSLGLPALHLPLANAVLPADPGLTFRTTATAARATAAGIAARAVIHAPAPSRTPSQHLPPTPTFDPKSALLLLWMAGIAVSFTQMFIAVLALWRTRRHAHPSPDVDLARSLAHSLGIHHSVRILETPAAMPMTAGILRPTIFLPREARSWSLERRRVVLLHELAHVRRGDAATHILARAALALHWWNPLAWTAWRGFIKERECAADDLVLTSGAPPADYAGHLLEIARALQPAPATAAVALSMARRSQLEGRLMAILDARIPRRQHSRTATLAATVLAIALIAPLAAVRAQSQAEQTVPPDVEATILAANAQRSHEILDRAAITYEQLRKFADAQKLREASLAMAEQIAGQQSAEYATALVNLGDLAVKRHALDEAINYYTQSLAHGDRAENFKALLFLGRNALMPGNSRPNYVPSPGSAAGTPTPPPPGQIGISTETNLAFRTTPPPASDLNKAATDPVRPAPDLNKALDYLQRARNVAKQGNDIGTAMTWMAMVREIKPEGASAAESLYRAALAIEYPDSTVQATTLDYFAHFLTLNQRADEAGPLQSQAAAIHKARANELSPTMVNSTQSFKVGGGATAPSLIFKQEPEYSDQARVAKFQGTVLLSVVIDSDGLAKNIQVIRALGMGLDEQAVQAVMQWKFKPGTRAGMPVPVQAQIEVNFRLL